MSSAIDDFVTGYASLSNLSLVKAHKLKNDASFVRDLTTNPDCRAIVTATIRPPGGQRTGAMAATLQSYQGERLNGSPEIRTQDQSVKSRVLYR